MVHACALAQPNAAQLGFRGAGLVLRLRFPWYVAWAVCGGRACCQTSAATTTQL
jgi:hypothetical protein